MSLATVLKQATTKANSTSTKVSKFNKCYGIFKCYNYKVLFDDAQKYATFFVRAVFNADVIIGFSDSKRHDDIKWEIIIGGWHSMRSVINSGNLGPTLVEEFHTKAEFDNFKHNLQVKI